MIEIKNGKWSVRLRPESKEEAEVLKTLNKPTSVGYLMYNGEFLIFNEYLPTAYERIKHAVQ